jgi:hypothetical protein
MVLAFVAGTMGSACKESSSVDPESLGHSTDRRRTEVRDRPSSVTARDPDRDTLAKLERQMDELRNEAGVDDPSDPSVPPGDLKADIEAFTTLGACVSVRAVRDPLMGDAIEALGYDTLVRDACRILEALKLKSKAACSPILSSVLRARCEADVAIASGRPEWCPTTGPGHPGAALDPTCLARASGDARLCATASEGARASCSALAKGDVSACGSDMPCRRQVARWRDIVTNRSPDRPATRRNAPDAGGP